MLFIRAPDNEYGGGSQVLLALIVLMPRDKDRHHSSDSPLPSWSLMAGKRSPLPCRRIPRFPSPQQLTPSAQVRVLRPRYLYAMVSRAETHDSAIMCS